MRPAWPPQAPLHCCTARLIWLPQQRRARLLRTPQAPTSPAPPRPRMLIRCPVTQRSCFRRARRQPQAAPAPVGVQPRAWTGRAVWQCAADSSHVQRLQRAARPRRCRMRRRAASQRCMRPSSATVLAQRAQRLGPAAAARALPQGSAGPAVSHTGDPAELACSGPAEALAADAAAAGVLGASGQACCSQKNQHSTRWRLCALTRVAMQPARQQGPEPSL